MLEGLVDTHCHLFLMDGEPAPVADRARESGVSAMVCAGIDPDSSRRSRELADSLAGVFATAGVHPHCALARETGKPLVVHTRDAWPDVLRILGEERVERVVLHCFSGGDAEAAEAAARGYHCSFAGNLTYPRNGDLRRAAAAPPRELPLGETDSPFLAPQSLRGRDKTPAGLSTSPDSAFGRANLCSTHQVCTSG